MPDRPKGGRLALADHAWPLGASQWLYGALGGCRAFLWSLTALRRKHAGGGVAGEAVSGITATVIAAVFLHLGFNGDATLSKGVNVA